ncbi:RNA methyltransferase [Chelativorans sp. Marseille-P2723]|uniref:TrmH family RNA methyltransferase n=1 Tax=Chelativorans sp. Marseille-P2723 TaxID=2709133 RepID=UPI00156ED2BB|nr:RNA methyltransferase [Chelativorans sp. Marseille-P2723]
MSEDRKTGTPKDSHYARLRRAHRARASEGGGGPSEIDEGLVRLYGLHTVRAALDNPARSIRRMWVTRNAAQRLKIADITALPFPAELVEPKAIDSLTGADAVHQGVLIEAEIRTPKTLSALGKASLVLVLDQITDPHNVGAIMRSAVAFGVDALVTTARHSPAESGVLAKAASGALEHIDHIEVRNLAESLEELHAAGFHTVGLDSDAPGPLEEALGTGRLALVLGAEGKGLRRKTRETVRALARLDMPGAIRSLNVSNAAAVALYIARQARRKTAVPGRR